MSEWTDEAHVIRLGFFQEANVWLRLLSRQHGLITVFAFGGRKSRHRFCGCLDLFNTLSCRIKSSGNGAYLTLQEAELLAGPRNLRVDWRKMGMAANCLQFVHTLEIDSESSGPSFTLLEELRKALERPEAVSIYLPHYFRLHLASLLGFAPQLQYCGKCHKPMGNGTAHFLAGEGRLFCGACAGCLPPSHRRAALQLEAAARLHMLHVKNSFPEHWSDARLSSNERRECAQAIQAFVNYHLDMDPVRNFLRLAG